MCLDVGAISQLGEQFLPEFEVLVEVGHHGQVHEGGLPRGLQEGGQLELLDQSEMSTRGVHQSQLTWSSGSLKVMDSGASPENVSKMGVGSPSAENSLEAPSLLW